MFFSASTKQNPHDSIAMSGTQMAAVATKTAENTRAKAGKCAATEIESEHTFASANARRGKYGGV